MSILVTGATGFVGTHLIHTLQASGAKEIHGLGRSRTRIDDTIHSGVEATLHVCDLLDQDRITDLLKEIQPAQIYHLAGYASPGRSFQEPDAAWDGNLLATRRLYDAVAGWGGKPRILFVGSGLIYGEHDLPLLGEETPLRPNSPYAASKAAADLASFQYTCAPGLDIIRARPFNHIGPGQSTQFAIPNFASQLVAIERGNRPPRLETGNLGSYRDLTDVRDVIAAYLLLMEKGQTAEAYNIASGRSQTMQEVVDRLIALSGVKVEIVQRADLVRPTDLQVPTVDISRMRERIGWQPDYSLDETLNTILNWYRTRN